VSRNDVVVPAGQTQATLNVTRSDSNESTPALSDQLATAITETLANVADDGPTTVRIRLDRPDLGTIHLQLSVTKDNVVSIRILTDNQHSQQIVESQMAALRLSLTGNGVACGQFQVGCDSNPRQFSSQNAPGQSMRPSGVFSPSRTSNSERLKFPVSRQNGRVNYVA
jgi:flagellar hook-length control protein FliK